MDTVIKMHTDANTDADFIANEDVGANIALILMRMVHGC